MEKPMEYTYINIQSWMISELGLKGNELIIYAIIYGFCQDGESRFKGGRSYLARWTNSTIRSVQNNLNHMVENGIIAKKERLVNGIKVCDYYPVNLPWESSSAAEYNAEECLPESDLETEDAPDDKEDCAGKTGRKHFSDGEKSSLGVKKIPQGSEKISSEVVKKVPQGSEKISPHNIKGNIYGNIESSSTSDSEDEQQLPFSPPKSVSGIERVVERWNSLQKYGINPVYKISQSSRRCKMLKARLREYGLKNVLRAVDNISFSEFLQGKNKNGWMITFDWFVRPDNFTKVLEGNYKNHGDAGKDGGSYADTGRDPQQYAGRNYQKSGEIQGTKGYNPADYFGSLLDA